MKYWSSRARDNSGGFIYTWEEVVRIHQINKITGRSPAIVLEQTNLPDLFTWPFLKIKKGIK